MLWSRSRRAARKTTAADPERRSSPRLDKVFPVYLEGEGGCGLGVARNISEGGMFVETRSPQPINSQVRVTFPSTAGELVAIAEVRYVCHLMGRGVAPSPDEVGEPRMLRGMGLRFLYFEAEPDGPHSVH